jgi:hypothetical protein
MAAPGIDVNLSKSVVAGLPSVPRDLTGSRRPLHRAKKQQLNFSTRKMRGHSGANKDSLAFPIVSFQCLSVPQHSF